MPFLIGDTRRILFLDHEKMKNKDGCKSSIIFIVSSESAHHKKLMSEPGIRVGSQVIPIIAPDLCVDEQDFLACTNKEEAYSKISDLVASLDINTSDKLSIGYSLIKQARRLSRRNSSSGTKLMIKVEINLETEYWWQGIVPATCSSIADLQNGRLADFAGEDSGEKSCPICLEEFQVASQVKRMPCLHIFHGHCIDQWLNKSHYCPVCRFELPASCVNFMH